MSLPQSFFDWINQNRSIRATVLIGSRARPADDPCPATEYSDWDFQMITTNEYQFHNRDWMKAAGLSDPLAYGVRPTFANVNKATVVWPDGLEMDLVLVKNSLVRLSRLLTKFGIHRRSTSVRKKLEGLSLVLSYGYRFIKGGSLYQRTWDSIANEVPHAHLNNEDCKQLADNLEAEALWGLRLIKRGEFRAVQRCLHMEMIETNIRLVGEIRRREGKVTYPDGRRLEQLLTPDELEVVTLSIHPNEVELKAAITKVRDDCRSLYTKLSTMDDNQG